MMETAVKLLMRHEGFRPYPYRCTAGKLTIGYGRNLEDRGLNEKEAEYLLRNDIEAAIERLRLEPYWIDLNETRQAVLVDMCVNMGWPRLSAFQKMRAALRTGDYQAAANEMVASRWYTQVKTRGPELVDLMRHGWAL